MTIFSDPFLFFSDGLTRSTWFTILQDIMMDSISFVRSLELEENCSLPSHKSGAPSFPRNGKAEAFVSSGSLVYFTSNCPVWRVSFALPALN